MKTLSTLLVLSLIAQGVISESVTLAKDDSHSELYLTGQGLIDLGTKLDKPLLKLIGQIVRRVENRIDKAHFVKIKDVIAEICRLHSCAEWSEWSKCDAIKLNGFGGQTRQRNCGLNTTLCTYDAKPVTVKDTRVCELECPRDYRNTNHGFCLKFYDKEKLARDDAENVCRGDGGHLVNIDSQSKVKYVNETILQRNFSADRIWIDGRKSVQGGKWTYGYKSTDTSFTFWGDNDPDNGSNDLCIIYSKGQLTNNIWRWFDYQCDDKYAFICQYQKIT